MVERQQRPAPSGADVLPGETPAAGPPGRGRRVLQPPANDNVMTVGQRVIRAAVFVTIGGILAWLLLTLFG